jgi:hypothetical protein
MLTRKLTILAATTAIGVAAFSGTASADPKSEPGCRGEATSGLAQEAGGLGHVTDTDINGVGSGFPVSPQDVQETFVRPVCEASS